MGNDTDMDGDALTAAPVSQPAHGTVNLGSDGSLVYTPNQHFNGTDSFTYTASDGELTSNPAVVTITVTPADDAPIAVDDTYPVEVDSVLTVGPGEGLLANDSDPDGDTLSVELLEGPTNGTLNLNSDGTFSYEHDGSENFSDAFTYVVTDADGGTWWSFTTADGVAPVAFAKLDTTLSEPIDSLSRVTMTWEPSYGAYYYEVCVDTTQACVAPEFWHNVGLATYLRQYLSKRYGDVGAP